MEPVIIVQGGAGDIGSDRIPGKLNGVQLAAKTGYNLLAKGASALDAIEAAVKVMEDDEYFNAGYGSVLNLAGNVQMEASIMNGSDLNAGAVTLIDDIKNPISLARLVMEKTPHVFLGGEGAKAFAAAQGIPKISPGSLITKNAQEALENFKKTGYVRTEIGSKEGDTVGAVALDKHGNIAAATSTGGMSGKMVGRIGDTPLIGAGTYADNNIGAVSTTGHGESILKYSLAHSIIKDMSSGASADSSTKQNLDQMSHRLKNTAGAVTISKSGDVGVYFTSKRMAWAYQRNNDQIVYGIEKNERKQMNVCD